MTGGEFLRVRELGVGTPFGVGKEEVEDLVEVRALDWPRRLGLPGGRGRVVVRRGGRPDDVREAVARPGQLVERAW